MDLKPLLQKWLDILSSNKAKLAFEPSYIDMFLIDIQNFQQELIDAEQKIININPLEMTNNHSSSIAKLTRICYTNSI